MINELYIVLWLLLMGAVWYFFRENGRLQYAKGMSDAIEMHSNGALQYKITKNKFGADGIEIKINSEAK